MKNTLQHYIKRIMKLAPPVIRSARGYDVMAMCDSSSVLSQ